MRFGVTSFGLLGPFGSDVDVWAQALREGRSAIHAVPESFIPKLPTPYVALYEGTLRAAEPFLKLEPSSAPRTAAFWTELASAARATLDGQSFDAVVFGNSHGLDHALAVQFLEQGDDAPVELAQPEEFCRLFLRGIGHADIPSDRIYCVSTTCTTALTALRMARGLLRRRESRRVLVLVSEVVVSDDRLVGLDRLGALTKTAVVPARASRPFAASRDGFVRGEGAGFLVLESCEGDDENQNVVSWIRGFGQTNDAYSMTDGPADAEGIARSIRLALEDAKMTPARIDYINVHGTSTQLNDQVEALALQKVFGEELRRIPVSSTKSQIGHTLNACGMVETIACILMLRDGFIAPNLNADDQDPTIVLRLAGAAEAKLAPRRILKTSIGFGGQNACVILEKN